MFNMVLKLTKFEHTVQHSKRYRTGHGLKGLTSTLAVVDGYNVGLPFVSAYGFKNSKLTSNRSAKGHNVAVSAFSPVIFKLSSRHQ